MNESSEIKNLKIMTRNVGFGMPTVEISLSKKLYWRTASILKSFINFIIKLFKL